MEAVASPRVADAQSLEHHERFCEMIGPVHSLLKAEIPSSAAKGGHPVKDIVPLFMYRDIIATGHSNHGHWTHSGISSK
jgi:hypothetical protein